MAQGRFLSKSVATDKAFNDISERAALVYMMTIPHLDRDGLILGDPDVLWGTVCPRRRELLDAMPAIIREWTSAGLVLSYRDQADPVLYFKGFQKNQILNRYSREAPSRFDVPPGYLRTDSGLTPDLLRTNSGQGTAKGEVKDEVEVKGEVEDEVPAATPPSSSGPSPERRQMIDRLAGEWPAGVGGTQIENHWELVELYGLDDWRRGFDATKREARANPRYVEKVIITERERANNGGKQRKSKVDESMDAVDRVAAMLEKENVEAWQ